MYVYKDFLELMLAFPCVYVVVKLRALFQVSRLTERHLSLPEALLVVVCGVGRGCKEGC